MIISTRWLAFGLFFAATAVLAADAGVVTIADGPARVLRGTIWYRLAAGAPFQEGDLIDAGDRALVQVEFASGGTVHIVGPASLYAAQLLIRNDKQDGPIELALDKGWLKLAAPAGPGMRLRTSSALVNVGEATLVARQNGKMFELFIESGAARIADSNRAGRDGAVHDAKAGEFWARDGDKPFTTAGRAPPQFVAAMPRHLMDRLASLAGKFKGKKTTLAVDREITLAEAEPWLAGPYRRAFARRLSGRLADPAFRNAVEANAAAYPDLDRILHPDKYPATQAGGAVAVPVAPAAPAPPPSARTPAPPSQATPQKPGQRSALPSIAVAQSAFAARNAR